MQSYLDIQMTELGEEGFNSLNKEKNFKA